MKILVASDKFKGSLSASEACDAIAEGIHEAIPEGSFEIRTLPIADGGDGMAATLTEVANGEWRIIEVQNALGASTKAGYGLIKSGSIAVIEMAEASGLSQLDDEKLDPWRASTFGTGQLIADAIGRGVQKIILGIGGSATNDGGSGMAEALGFQFLDQKGKPVSTMPERLDEVASITPPLGTSFPEVIVACDVSNPLLGPDGCTQIYGPQKGISPEAIGKHEARLECLMHLIGDAKLAECSGAGAAGGLGFGAVAFLGAKLVPGFDLVAEMLQMEDAVSWADLVITGEGKLDHQSLEGKAPFGITQMARRLGKSTAAFCGILDGDGLESEFGPIFEIRRSDLSTSESMARGAELLREASAKNALTLTSLNHV